MPQGMFIGPDIWIGEGQIWVNSDGVERTILEVYPDRNQRAILTGTSSPTGIGWNQNHESSNYIRGSYPGIRLYWQSTYRPEFYYILRSTRKISFKNNLLTFQKVKT